MSQQIHLAAIVLRDGQLLLHREHEAAPWGLPGGPLLPEHEDVDTGMDAILDSIGISAPAIEEDFVETVLLANGEGHVVFNIYAPTDWTGEPRLPGGQSSWFGLYDLDALDMNETVRAAVLAAFGLRERDDHAPEILAAIDGALPPELTSQVTRPRSSAGGGRDDTFRSTGLDRRTRSLLVVAMLAALGHRELLRAHIDAGLSHGATPEQIVETLRMVGTYAGLPAASEAWPVMERAFAERGIAHPGRVQ